MEYQQVHIICSSFNVKALVIEDFSNAKDAGTSEKRGRVKEPLKESFVVINKNSILNTYRGVSYCQNILK